MASCSPTLAGFGSVIPAKACWYPCASSSARSAAYSVVPTPWPARRVAHVDAGLHRPRVGGALGEAMPVRVSEDLLVHAVVAVVRGDEPRVLRRRVGDALRDLIVRGHHDLERDRRLFDDGRIDLEDAGHVGLGGEPDLHGRQCLTRCIDQVSVSRRSPTIVSVTPPCDDRCTPREPGVRGSPFESSLLWSRGGVPCSEFASLRLSFARCWRLRIPACMPVRCVRRSPRNSPAPRKRVPRLGCGTRRGRRSVVSIASAGSRMRRMDGAIGRVDALGRRGLRSGR